MVSRNYVRKYVSSFAADSFPRFCVKFFTVQSDFFGFLGKRRCWSATRISHTQCGVVIETRNSANARQFGDVHWPGFVQAEGGNAEVGTGAQEPFGRRLELLWR
jgi:hypothetical protein